MPANSLPPSDAAYRDAVRSIRLAWLVTKLISDRLKWTATTATLDADTSEIMLRDALVNRDGG